MRLKAHLTNAPARADGLGVGHIVGKFRADFRLAMLMALVRRAGAVQLGSGLPTGCVRGDFSLIDVGRCRA